MREHGRDYILMKSPAGEVEEVSTEGNAIPLKLVQGYHQVKPSDEEPVD